jgi:hypothetical protein
VNFDFNALKIQVEEVSKIKIMKLESLITAVFNEKNNFVPHGKDYYTFVFNELKKLYI